MTSVIVVFPKIEDAKNIKNLLARSGFHVLLACTTGAQALQQMNHLDGGVVVCGYKMADMIYSQLRDYMPPQFEMLLVASQNLWSECSSSELVCLAMPIKVHELVNTLGMMVQAQERRRKKAKQKGNLRSPEEQAIILEAKRLLMERNNMTEEDAHRYIQKCSMDSGTNMVETAQMVLSIMDA
ncbi:MAG: response regulator [Lachnospiraceae bacterium]|nr:response regulator [Lachnospiraceae bacterium]